MEHRHTATYVDVHGNVRRNCVGVTIDFEIRPRSGEKTVLEDCIEGIGGT